jgi:triacylglycerol lipase
LPGADNRFLPGAAHVDLAFRPEVIEHTFTLAQRS